MISHPYPSSLYYWALKSSRNGPSKANDIAEEIVYFSSKKDRLTGSNVKYISSIFFIK
ncbi:hypothetical protein HMPREF3189_01257 [Clostridiales bacterium KA00134]|nr:hypothetical protein HMPREF3189_01257 [Clostridiales bacterium KA00134]